jgi:hypothetical protein
MLNSHRHSSRYRLRHSFAQFAMTPERLLGTYQVIRMA